MAQRIQEEVSRPRKKVPAKTHKPDSMDHGATGVGGILHHANDESKLKGLRKKIPKDKASHLSSSSIKSVKLNHHRSGAALDGDAGDEENKKKKKKEHKKDKKKKKRKDSLGCSPPSNIGGFNDLNISDIVGDSDPNVFAQCKEKMRPVKKSLKLLDSRDDSLTPYEQKQQMDDCLVKIGARIRECMDEFKDNEDESREWRNRLWTFVSRFTEYNPKKLYKMYKQATRKQDDATSGEGDSHLHPQHKRDKYKNRHKSRYHSGSGSRHHFTDPSSQAEAMDGPPLSSHPQIHHYYSPYRVYSSQGSGGPASKRPRNEY